MALLAAWLAAGHWFFGLCYSRGYDFFLWLYNAWWSAAKIESGGWPNWSSHSAAGHPFFKMAGVSDALVFGSFVGPLGAELGTQVYVVLLYSASALGVYALARYWGASQSGAAVGAAAYVFSWFITYTSYYQTYLNNFLSYAMMPWGALCLGRAMRREASGQLLLAAAMLCISMTSNAQISIRFALFAMPVAWIDAVVGGGVRIRRALLYSAAFVGLAACWSAFLIVPALALRGEVLLLGAVRPNWFIPPWAMLTWLPLSGLHFLHLKLGGDGLVGHDILYWAMHSDYLGLSVVAIAVVGGYVGRKRGPVRWLLGLLGVYFVLYFLVVPLLPASAWVGRTHNWAIMPTLVLAMLCSLGCDYIARHRQTLREWAGWLCGVLIALDLGGASFALNRLGVTHTPLDELPEVGVWRQVWAEAPDGAEGRWFTYNPDHTHYLYPIMTSRETANIAELRSRTWEYDSFIEHQRRSMRQRDPAYRPAEALALLNCQFVDLPARLYDFRGEVDDYAAGIALLQHDQGLTEVLRRPWHALDQGFDHTRVSSELVDLARDRVEADTLGQVVWRVAKTHWAFAPEMTVFLVGDSRVGQHFFERITLMEQFRANRLLFAFHSGDGDIDPRVLAAVGAQVVTEGAEPIEGIPQWDMEQIENFYATSPEPIDRSLRRVAASAERLEIALTPQTQPAFLFLSQQRFIAWRAYDGAGRELPVLKAAAGLTAICVPAGVDQIFYQYEVPQSEKLARLFSLLCALGAGIWGIYNCGRGIRWSLRDQPGANSQDFRSLPALWPNLVGAKVLDLGCGSGLYLDELEHRGAVALGVDSDRAALQSARESGHSRLVCADAGQLPFRAGVFDMVLSVEVMTHIAPQPRLQVLQGITGVLKEGGLLFCTLHNRLRLTLARWARLRRPLEFYPTDRLDVWPFDPRQARIALGQSGLQAGTRVHYLNYHSRFGDDFCRQRPWLAWGVVAVEEILSRLPLWRRLAITFLLVAQRVEDES